MAIIPNTDPGALMTGRFELDSPTYLGEAEEFVRRLRGRIGKNGITDILYTTLPDGEAIKVIVLPLYGPPALEFTDQPAGQASGFAGLAEALRSGKLGTDKLAFGSVGTGYASEYKLV